MFETKIRNDCAAFNALRTVDFRFLKSLSFERETIGADLSGSMCVKIILKDKLGQRLTLICNGVVDTKIGNVDAFGGIMLAIKDVRSWQREDINYEICDAEGLTFSFQCNNFEIDIG